MGYRNQQEIETILRELLAATQTWISALNEGQSLEKIINDYHPQATSLAIVLADAVQEMKSFESQQSSQEMCRLALLELAQRLDLPEVTAWVHAVLSAVYAQNSLSAVLQMQTEILELRVERGWLQLLE